MDAIDRTRHPIADAAFIAECRTRLACDGALVVPGFFTPEAIERIVAESSEREADAFFAASTHNVFLTEGDASSAADHVTNRQVVSTKGLIADDQIPAASPLRSVYDDPAFRSFLCGVLDVAAVHPYDDDLSSINVHFAPEGRELGWHFDNSSFAVTMLLRAPEAGGVFEYVSGLRSPDRDWVDDDGIAAVLDGAAPVLHLDFAPGDLVLFRGRDALHRVTPTVGDITRLLVVFAYNETPGVALSESALATFYGRAG